MKSISTLTFLLLFSKSAWAIVGAGVLCPIQQGGERQQLQDLLVLASNATDANPACHPRPDDRYFVRREKMANNAEIGIFSCELCDKMEAGVQKVIEQGSSLQCPDGCRKNIITAQMSVPTKFHRKYEKFGACQKLLEQTKKNPLKQTKTFKSNGISNAAKCIKENFKKGQDWVQDSLTDRSGYFWTNCPDPCSYTSVIGIENRIANSSCESVVTIHVVCGHKRDGNAYDGFVSGVLQCR